MAAQQGFEYEKNAANVLKPMGLVPSTFMPAGASHNQPDLMLIHNGRKSGCELKITTASAGSLVLKYVDGKWQFSDIDKEDEEKQFIKDLGHEVSLFTLIRSKWKEIPYKREPKDTAWKATIGKMNKRDMYERDKKAFQDIKGEIPASKIEQYYNKKDTYYVNVGTHGFYLLGTSNPLGLKNVPRFGTSSKATFRARVQYKGSDTYQFTFEMQFSITKRSIFNIAPVKGKSVQIDTQAINASCFV